MVVALFIKAPTVGIFERKRARRTQEAQMNEVLSDDARRLHTGQSHNITTKLTYLVRL